MEKPLELYLRIKAFDILGVMKKIYFVVAVFAVLLLVGASYYFGRSSVTPQKTTVVDTVKSEVNSDAPCTRTTRLENAPQYDRALSLLHQKLDGWNPNNDSSENYFPPASLLNCIQVVESDVTGTIGAEGYFEVNNKNIKQDYYPITVDKSYSYADDLLNALILLHEVTHVQQFIDAKSGKTELSCIDKEVEAFYSSWKLFGTMNSEEWKSIDFRLTNDKDLHPQLQIIEAIREQTGGANFQKDREMCLYGSGKNDPSCIDNNRKAEIKEMLLQDDFYKKQCSI